MSEAQQSGKERFFWICLQREEGRLGCPPSLCPAESSARGIHVPLPLLTASLSFLTW